MTANRQMIIAGLISIFSMSFFLLTSTMPTLDGSAHIYVAHVHNQITDGQQNLFDQFFQPHNFYLSNAVTHYLAAYLLHLFDYVIVEKIIFALCLLFLSSGLFFLASCLTERRLFVFLCALPLVHSTMLYLGFYNLIFGLGAFVYFVGFVLLSYKTKSLKNILFAVLFLGLSYFCHLFAFLNDLLFLTVFGAGALGYHHFVYDKNNRYEEGRRHRYFSYFCFACLASGFAVIVLMLLADGINDFSFWLPNFIQVISLMVVISAFHMWALFISACLIALLLLSILRTRTLPGSEMPVSRILLLILLSYFLICVCLPYALFGVVFISTRFLLFFYVIFIAFISCRYGMLKVVPVSFYGIAVLISLITLLDRFVGVTQADKEMAKFVKIVEFLEPESTILSIYASPRATDVTGIVNFRRTHVHASTKLALERNLIDLKVVQLHSDHFITKYKDEVNPYWLLPADADYYPFKRDGHDKDTIWIEATSPAVDLVGYEQRSGQPVDYVLLWGNIADWQKNPNSNDLILRLKTGYHEIKTHDPDQFRLYRHN